MTSEQTFRLLGLSVRARKMITGEELVIKEVRAKRAHLVILASDASERTKKTVTDKCSFYGVPVISFADRYMLGAAIGKEARVVLGVLDAGFAKSIKKSIEM
ncbi:MAG: YlxQ family RNA-binding protein [Bacilli bacterium]